MTTRGTILLSDAQQLSSGEMVDEEHFLARLLRRSWASQTGNNGRRAETPLFVDRDPTHFRLLLNFLRDGFCVLPEKATELLELTVEARFYGLPGLERMAADRSQELQREKELLVSRSIEIASQQQSLHGELISAMQEGFQAMRTSFTE